MLKKETVKVYVKIGGPDPSNEQLADIATKANQYLNMAHNLSNGRIDGKYVVFDLTRNEFMGTSQDFYVQGIITGMLIEKGIEVI
jgi:uncharacterized protein (DUF2164 family)